MAPGATDAICVTACICGAPCATAADDTHNSTRPPTAADAIHLAVFVIVHSGRPLTGVALRRGDREVDVPRQRLVGHFIGDLDLKPVLTIRKRRERHGLPALQLVARGEVEL